MNNPLKNLVLFAALAMAFGLGLPAAALAGSGSPAAGVHVDPGSPVAKEYALPLATARGAPADTGSSGSLFGTGIKKNKSPRPSSTRTASEPPSSTPDTETVPATSETSPAAQSRDAAHRHHRHRAARKPAGKPSRKHARGSIPAGGNAKTPPTALRILHPGSGLSWLWMMLAALAVLALGSSGAFVLMRTRNGEADPHPN